MNYSATSNYEEGAAGNTSTPRTKRLFRLEIDHVIGTITVSQNIPASPHRAGVGPRNHAGVRQMEFRGAGAQNVGDSSIEKEEE